MNAAPNILTLTFRTPSGTETIAVPEGTTIFDAAAQLGLDTGGVCAQGACGLCRVMIPDSDGALSPLTDAEEMHLGNIPTGERLACQCSPLRDITVELLS